MVFFDISLSLQGLWEKLKISFLKNSKILVKKTQQTGSRSLHLAPKKEVNKKACNNHIYNLRTFRIFFISQHKKVLPIDVAEVMHSDLRRRVVKFVKPFKEFQAWMARGSKSGSDQPASPDEVGHKNILFH